MRNEESRQSPHCHAVRFYDDDESLARIVAKFLAEGLEAGAPGIVIATAAQRAAVIRALTARSVNVDELQRSRDLLLLDAEDTLSTFMVDGRPDARKFREQIGHAIESVCSGRTDCAVRMFGQMVDVLWQGGHHDVAIRLEVLWNQLAQTRAFSLLCGYAVGHFYKGANLDVVCHQHSHVVAPDGQLIASREIDRDVHR
jgi:hypothetical protein